MWKKALMAVIALIGSFSVGYAFYNHEMSAASSTVYHAGGTITGRVNIVPSGISGTNIGFQKGDRVLMGVQNPYTGKSIDWQLIRYQTYTDYGCSSASTSCSNQPINAWLSLTNNPIGYMKAGLVDTDFTAAGGAMITTDTSTQDRRVAFSGYRNVTALLDGLNSDIHSTNDERILTYRDLTLIHRIYQIQGGAANSKSAASMQQSIFSRTADHMNSVFLPNSYELIPQAFNTDASLAPLAKDIAFAYDYMSSACSFDTVNNQSIVTILSSGTRDLNSVKNNYNDEMYVRGQAFLSMENVVFGVSKGTSSSIGSISAPSASTYTYLYRDAIGEAMKLRVMDTSMSATLSRIINSSNQPIVKAAKDSIVYLDASANAGSSSDGVNTVSVLIFNNSSEFIYYMPLEAAKGTGVYDLDLTGIPKGKYKVGIVNEVYNEISDEVANSSGITNVIPLEIVEPLSDLTFTPKTTLQVNLNVNVGDAVGTISSQNGAGIPTYAIIADPAYPNEYQNVTLASDGKTVVVKGAPLHAGTYHFKLQAQDGNGDPDPALGINASFTVNQTNLSVAFDTTSLTKKSITEATTGWNEPATANPSTGTKVTYAKSGGSVGLINIDPDTGRITYAGSGGYGKVEIKATADDDPASGYDDYNRADTTKEILIYREVDGSVTPHANSSDTTNPTFQTSDANIKPNGIIGNITGTLGIPDNAASGTTTYTYGLKNIDDDNYFSVNPSTGEIKTTADLSTTTGTYHITVTVSDKWSTKEIPVTISVGLAGAEDLKFYETTAAIKAITSKSVKVTDTGVNVYATVKGSSNTNPVTYRLKAGEPTNVIDVHPNSGAVTIKGVGTVIIVAEKAGTSGQADAVTELAFTVSAGAQNFIYTDDVGDELPKSGSYYSIYKETYAPNKTFQLYTSGNPTGSSVTYQLKAGSPSDVISVDPSGLVTILNASLNNQKGKVIVQATSHDPSGNYDDKTIELPIDIDKGTRMIAFADHPITVVNGSGSVAPNILADGVLDTSGTAMIEVDVSEDNSIAWTSDGITIQYSWNDVNGKDIKLHVTKPADRNYKEAKAEGTLHILGADESSLTVSTPGKIIYGDHFTIRSTQDDSASSNVQYSFTSDNAVFISAPTVSGNKAEFDAIGNSGNTEITITVTRTADGEVPLSKTIKIKVLPKPIMIQIDDQTRKRLEGNPPLTFQDITPQLVSWGGVKDNVDTSVLHLSTTAKKYSPIGSYSITSKNYTTLNDNYPNYIFTLKEGLLNVIDNGNKDFWDIDDDGCPDLNIQIKDEDGNVITINGDRNEDGIPDYNIDSNGDGKPDLNIDTDNDGKPDLNLVILKEWKPTKCVTLDDIQFSSGINAKAQINIDIDSDLIPDIDIDTDGDFKADFNIDTDNDGKANVNIGSIHSQWTPDKDYKYQGFAYDTIEKSEPLLNIDTDGDGRPDLNLDLDDDGVADINIDVDGDFIPDVNIDSTGDGKPDLNLDPDEDGNPTKNVVKITEWKPEHNVNEPFAYDTMKMDNIPKLEDNGVTVEKPNGDPFLPNMALKVTDVTANKKAEVINQASDLIKEDQEVKRVYDIKLLENGVEVKPDGTLKIRIPIPDGYTNPILLKQKENGDFERIDTVLKDGYLIYESDELGIVAIIADIIEGQPNPDNEVKGNYYPGNNTGGALTGDSTNMMLYLGTGFVSFGLICLILFKRKQGERN